MFTDSLKFFLGFICGVMLYFVLYQQWKFSEKQTVSFGDIFIRLAERLETTEDSKEEDTTNVINLDKDIHYQSDNFSLANQLRDRIKVMCVIIVDYRQADRRLKILNETWVRRCSDVVLFTMRTRTEILKFKHHILSIPDTQNEELYKKRLYEILSKIHKNGTNNSDWTMLATDDTYVIMENLRYFLSDLNASLPFFIGRIDPSEYIVLRNLKKTHKLSFSSVFSKAALASIVSAYSNQSIVQVCKETGAPGDIYRDLCLENLEIKSLNGTDKYGLQRFNVLIPELWGEHIIYRDIQSKEPMTLSDFIVSFRYVDQSTLHGLELMAYHLRPFGITHPHEDVNRNNVNRN